MNLICIPFDISFQFDEQLHEIPNAPKEVQSAVEFLQQQLDEVQNNRRQQIYYLGLIGVYARILNDFSLSNTALTTAIALSRELNDEVLKTINQLRLAHLYQWQQQYEQSDRLFKKLLIRCINNPALASCLDFVYQHTGKSQFDQQQYTKAQKYFEQALALRLRKGDSTLIASTQFALQMTQKQLAACSVHC
jgi:tetratricopeptide (TPR) repeat protein